MRLSLTKREKILIFIMVVIVFFFAATQFAILPLYDRYTLALDEYDLLSGEKMLLDAKFQNENQIRLANADAQTAFEDIRKCYPNTMFTEKVDQLLTGICLDNRLTPVSLKMSEQVGLSELLQREEDTDIGNADESPNNFSAFIIMEADMNLFGDYNDLKSLLDMVAPITYLRITRVAYSIPENSEMGASSNISVCFEVSMLNDVQPVSAG